RAGMAPVRSHAARITATSRSRAGSSAIQRVTTAISSGEHSPAKYRSSSSQSVSRSIHGPKGVYPRDVQESATPLMSVDVGLEEFAELAEGARDPDLDGLERDVEHSGDLGIGQVMAGAKDQHLSQRRAQPFDCLVEGGRELGGRQLRVGARHIVA